MKNRPIWTTVAMLLIVVLVGQVALAVDTGTCTVTEVSSPADAAAGAFAVDLVCTATAGGVFEKTFDAPAALVLRECEIDLATLAFGTGYTMTLKDERGRDVAAGYLSTLTFNGSSAGLWFGQYDAVTTPGAPQTVNSEVTMLPWVVTTGGRTTLAGTGLGASRGFTARAVWANSKHPSLPGETRVRSWRR